MNGIGAILAAFLVLTAPAVWAQDLGLIDFAGRYSGEGPPRIDPASGLPARDIAVEIVASADGGFEIAWTGTVGETRETVTRLRFEPAATAGVWRARESGDPLRGAAVIWAYVDKRSLVINGFRVAPDGRHVLLRYGHTLGDGALELSFLEDRAGRLGQAGAGLMLEDLD